jgi:hypothetical protein
MLDDYGFPVTLVLLGVIVAALVVYACVSFLQGR